MKDNHLSKNEIAQAAEFLFNNKYNKLSIEIRTHLKNCNECAGQVEFLVSILQDDKNNKKGISVIKLTPYFAAASIIIALLFLFPFKNKLAKLPDDVSIVDKFNSQLNPDSLIVNKEIQEYANKEIAQSNITSNEILFADNPNLEILVERFKTKDRSCDIVIKSESVIKTKKTTLLLNWENDENIEVSIEIYNNKEELIKTFNTNGNFIELEKLDAGLYYWNLINDEYDLLFFGKIIVKP